MTLAQILAKFEVDNADLKAEIEGYVTSAVTKNTGGTIPEARFKEVIGERNKLRADVIELNSKIDGMTGDADTVKKLTEERDAMSGKLKAIDEKADKAARDRWAAAAKSLDVAEGDAKFDAAKKAKDSGRFTFAEKDAELPIDDVHKNLLAFDTFTDAGLFEPIPAKGSGTNQLPAKLPAKPKTNFRKSWGG